MAGEYVRWLARDVKPMEKKELTPQEKRRNWWDYHKWHVVIAIVCLILAADLAFDVVRNARNEPDYTIAYVGVTALPGDLIEAVEEAVAEHGEDLNGNGKVQVELRQYVLYDGSGSNPALALEDTERSQASSLLLQGNIEAVESMIFLLEDPEFFRTSFPILCRTDGSLVEDTPDSDVPLYYLWEDCPQLAGLELPNFEVPVIDGMVQGDSQAALGKLGVARRGLWDDGTNDTIRGNIALFERITEGAK